MDWPILVPASRQAEWAQASPAAQSSATAFAIRILWGLTGRVFGTVTETVRPCAAPSPAFSTYGGRYRAAGRYPSGVVQGPLLLTSCGCTTSPCPCAAGSEIALPGPVAAVVSVTIDGTVIDPAEYKVRDRRWLCRLVGGWPQHQDMTAADDVVGAFTVTYRRGIVPPDEGQIAAGWLATEVLRAMKDGVCALPTGVTSIARQGTTIEVDPVAYMDEGLTGVAQVDQWIRAVNPGRVTAPPSVVSPDLPDQVSRFS